MFLKTFTLLGLSQLMLQSALAAPLTPWVIAPGLDISGNDLSSAAGSSALDCAQQCVVLSGCKAVTYIIATTTCYFKVSTS